MRGGRTNLTHREKNEWLVSGGHFRKKKKKVSKGVNQAGTGGARKKKNKPQPILRVADESGRTVRKDQLRLQVRGGERRKQGNETAAEGYEIQTSWCRAHNGRILDQRKRGGE